LLSVHWRWPTFLRAEEPSRDSSASFGVYEIRK
jgi:hypothetical protein